MFDNQKNAKSLILQEKTRFYAWTWRESNPRPYLEIPIKQGFFV
nr:MAG TPA: hypothetical protein [Caudoviricetes sp.]